MTRRSPQPGDRGFGVLLNFVGILTFIFWSVKHYFYKKVKTFYLKATIDKNAKIL